MYEVKDIEIKKSKKEHIFAFILITFCIITGLGNWILGVKHKERNIPLPKEIDSFSPLKLKERADIGIIDINGPIFHSSSDFSGTTSSEKIVRLLKKASECGVKGIIIKINSPGGSAAAAQSIYNQINNLKIEKNIKFITIMGDVAASGGYYIASASDLIFAQPSTLTGSIGVIAYIQNFKGLFDKIGISSNVIKSGKFKDIGANNRAMTQEERKILQDLINDTYEQFIEAVAKGRKMKIEEVRKLADGRIYSGNQAQKNKLIDRLGGYNEALKAMIKLIKVSDPEVRNFSSSNWESLFSEMFNSKINNILSNKINILGNNSYNYPFYFKIPLMLYE